MNLLKDFDGTIDQSGEKLLLHFYGGIGDLLWRTCLLKELKKRNPNLYIGVASQGPHWKLIYQNNPHINELIDDQGDKDITTNFDLYCSDKICMHVTTDYGKTMHCIDAIAYWAGIEIKDKTYEYCTSEKEKKWAKKFLKQFKPKTIIGFGMKGSSWVRRWDPIEVLRLTKLLIMNDYHVVLFDDRPIEWKDENLTKMTGGYNVRELACIIEAVDCMFSLDTGALHFSGHFHKPTVALFCGTSPELRSSHYPTVVSMVPPEGSCQQWPCFLHGPHCGKGLPVPCALHYKAEDVFEKLKEMENAT